MDSICRDLDFVFAYIDDILIVSKDEQQHNKHLQTLFQRLADHRLILNKDKCVFGASELDFLKYHISQEGLCPPKGKVDAIINFEVPKTIRDFSTFLAWLRFTIVSYLRQQSFYNHYTIASKVLRKNSTGQLTKTLPFVLQSLP